MNISIDRNDENIYLKTTHNFPIKDKCTVSPPYTNSAIYTVCNVSLSLVQVIKVSDVF